MILGGIELIIRSLEKELDISLPKSKYKFSKNANYHGNTVIEDNLSSYI